MANDRHVSPKRLIPMCALLALLLLCGAELAGWFALLFFFPLALCMLPLFEERLYGYAILCDVLIAAFVLLLPVPHYVWLAFVCILAPYVPVRHAMRNARDPRRAVFLSIGVTVLWTALVFGGLHLIGVHPLTLLPLPVTLLAALGVLFFLFLLDILYQLSLKAYVSRVRRFLLPRA